MQKLSWPFKPPYSWQETADRKLKRLMGRNVLLAAPCGFGKEAVVARHAVRRALQGCRVVWLTARAFSGERNKVKELKALLEANPHLHVKAVSFKAKDASCNYLPEWAKEVGLTDVSRVDVNDFCTSMRKGGACPYKSPEEAPEWSGILSGDAAPRGYCRYYWLKKALLNADVAIMDYNYAVHPAIRKAFSPLFDKRTDVFFDEAHTLAKRLEAAFEAKLSTRSLKAALKESEGWFIRDPKLREEYLELTASFPGLEQHLENVLKRVEELAEERKSDLEAEAERSGEAKALIGADELLTPEVERAADFLSQLKVGETVRDWKFTHAQEIGAAAVRSHILSAERFLRIAKRLRGEHWASMYVEVHEGRRDEEAGKRGVKKRVAVGLALLDPRILLRPLLRRVGTALFYSGTIYPRAFVNHLDLAVEALTRFKSPFPPESRIDVFSGEVEVTRSSLKDAEASSKVAGAVSDWFRICAKPGVDPVAAMTYKQFETLKPLLEARGLKLQMVEWVPRERREEYLNGLFAGEGPYVTVSPYGWASMSMDFPNTVKAVLMVGIPVARMTPENREKIRYFAESMKRKGMDPEKAYGAARRWLITAQAMQYHVQANSRARVTESKVATLWLDRRFVEDPWLVSLVRGMTKRENIAVEPDLNRAMQRIGQFLDAATS